MLDHKDDLNTTFTMQIQPLFPSFGVGIISSAWLLVSGLLSLTILVFPAPAFAENPGAKPMTLCASMRMERQHEINRNPDIEQLVPLRKSSNANCFIPSENLYFASLVAAEKKLGLHAPWYQTIGEEIREKARLACEVMGYGDSPQTMTMTMNECIAVRHNEMMNPYNDQYRQESIQYINKRNDMGAQLVEQCVSAFYQKLPKLPRQIQFPLAYYDRKIHAYPSWYLESQIHDDDWLVNMQKTMASHVITKALGTQCPGDMIWWLYLST